MRLQKPPPPGRPAQVQPNGTLRCPGDGAVLGVLSEDGSAVLIRCPACKADHVIYIAAKLQFADGRAG